MSDRDRTLDAGSLSRPEPLRRVDQVMEIVGIALLPVGLTALAMGWLGVASNGYVFLQLPYVVSGGMVGLGLLVASGTIYLASWISRAAAVQRRQNEELLRAVTQLHQALTATSVTGGGPGGTNGHGVVAFLATPSGTMFHRPDCAIVTGRDDLHEVAPDAAGMKPCGMCDPLGIDTTTMLPSVN